jgi:hypothetical protein
MRGAVIAGVGPAGDGVMWAWDVGLVDDKEE